MAIVAAGRIANGGHSIIARAAGHNLNQNVRDATRFRAARQQRTWFLATYAATTRIISCEAN